MSEPFAHRFASFGDQAGDIDLHLPGLLGEPAAGLWNGLNVLVGREGLIIPRPGLKSLSGWGNVSTSAWAGLSGLSKANAEVFAAFDGSTSIYSALADAGSPTWSADADVTTGYDGDAAILPINLNSDGPLIARFDGTSAYRIAELGDWVTVLTTNTNGAKFGAGAPSMVIQDSRIYAPYLTGVSYSPTDPTTTWTGEFTPGLELASSSGSENVNQLVSHDQGLFIQRGSEVYLLSGNPESGDLQLVADQGTVYMIGGEGQHVTGVGLDGSVLDWNGSTFEASASQFRSLLANRNQASAIVIPGTNSMNTLIPYASSGGFLLRYNGFWSQHQLHQTSWGLVAGTPSSVNMLAQVDLAKSGLHDRLDDPLNEMFMVPSWIDESGTDRARLCLLAFDDAEPFTPATDTDSLESDTADPQGQFSTSVTLPTRWTDAGRQFRVRRVVVGIKRAGSTETGDNELDLKLTTYDRNKATVSSEFTKAWSETATTRDVDFVVWNLDDDAPAGDGYRLQVTQLVGMGIRFFDVFGEIESGHPW